MSAVGRAVGRAVGFDGDRRRGSFSSLCLDVSVVSFFSGFSYLCNRQTDRQADRRTLTSLLLP